MLIENQVFKNYKELCIYLNEPIKVGGAKLNQLKHWEKYFTFQKEDNKKSIRITKIMQDLSEVPPRERKTRSDAIWEEHISIQLYHSIAELVKSATPNRYGVNSLVLSTQEAFEEVGLVNSDFKALTWNIDENKPLSSSVIFARAAGDRFYRVLYNVIHSLNGKHIICSQDTYTVYETANSSVLRLATSEEYAAIHLAMMPLLEDKYAHKDGTAGTKYSVNLRGLNKPFYTDLKRILEPLGIYFGYKVYNISFNEASIKCYEKYLRKDNDIAFSKGKINKEAYETIKKLIEKDVFKLPKEEDTRSYDDLMNMLPADKSVYFELLEQTVLLKPEETK